MCAHSICPCAVISMPQYPTPCTFHITSLTVHVSQTFSNLWSGVVSDSTIPWRRLKRRRQRERHGCHTSEPHRTAGSTRCQQALQQWALKQQQCDFHEHSGPQPIHQLDKSTWAPPEDHIPSPKQCAVCRAMPAGAHVSPQRPLSVQSVIVDIRCRQIQALMTPRCAGLQPGYESNYESYHNRPSRFDEAT